MEKIKGLSKNQISIGTLCAVLVALLLSAVSCSNPRESATSKKAPSPPVEVKDPILSMIMASSIDAKGEIVNPRFTFPPNEPQVTAIVSLGTINGSQLNVTWYKTSESGDEKLFEHQIQVKSNGRAFSVGKNQGGTLSIGTYKVVATLDGQTNEVEFDVSPAKKKQKSTSNRSDENVFENRNLMQMVAWKSASSQKAHTTPTGSTPATGSSPVAGPSGTVPSPPNPPSGPTASGCGFGARWEASEADRLTIKVHGSCDEPQHKIHVSASITGAYESFGEYGVGDYPFAIFGIDPCLIPGGSDLPGTKVAVKWEVLDVSRKAVLSDNEVIDLGEDTLAPRINVVSTPARGTKVKAGDKIKLNVTATEKRSGGPWQTGVKIIQVTADPGGLVKDPWTNPSNLPKSCGEKTWEQKDEATYTVPKDPPAVIRICAITEDYVGNESSKCGEFPTGDIWKGDVHLTLNFGPGCSTTADAQLALSVGENGQVSGTATGRGIYNRAGCGGGSMPMPFSGPVSGRLSGRRFDLTLPWGFGSDYGKMTAQLDGPTSARNTATDMKIRTYTIKLDCTTCSR